VPQPSLAAALPHPGLFAAVVIAGFVLGGYGHATRSRALIIISIVVIGAVSLYVVAAGEVASFNK
jgi:hypothetical protein